MKHFKSAPRVFDNLWDLKGYTHMRTHLHVVYIGSLGVLSPLKHITTPQANYYWAWKQHRFGSQWGAHSTLQLTPVSAKSLNHLFCLSIFIFYFLFFVYSSSYSIRKTKNEKWETKKRKLNYNELTKQFQGNAKHVSHEKDVYGVRGALLCALEIETCGINATMNVIWTVARISVALRKT